MHKNEFAKTYPETSISFPAVLLKMDNTLKMLLSAEDFTRVKDLPDLMKTLNEKLKNV